MYDALAFFSETPRNLGDSMWLTYVHRLQAEREATGFVNLEIQWIKEPEVAYTHEQPIERYYIPGDLKINYKGEDWDTENSHQILEKGFQSSVLQNFLKNSEFAKQKVQLKFDKNWYERPLGIISLGVIIAIIAGGVIFLLGWN